MGAEFHIHLVIVRRADARIADLLDLPAHAHLAAGAGHQAAHTAYDEGQQSRNSQSAKADAHATAGAAVHQVPQQKPRGSTQKGGRGEGAGFDPSGCRFGMLV